MGFFSNKSKDSEPKSFYRITDSYGLSEETRDEIEEAQDQDELVNVIEQLNYQALENQLELGFTLIKLKKDETVIYGKTTELPQPEMTNWDESLSRFSKKSPVPVDTYPLQAPSGLPVEEEELEEESTIVEEAAGDETEQGAAFDFDEESAASDQVPIPEEKASASCPYCGEPIDPQAILCPYCGESLLESEEVQEEVEESVPLSPPVREAHGKEGEADSESNRVLEGNITPNIASDITSSIASDIVPDIPSHRRMETPTDLGALPAQISVLASKASALKPRGEIERQVALELEAERRKTLADIKAEVQRAKKVALEQAEADYEAQLKQIEVDFERQFQDEQRSCAQEFEERSFEEVNQRMNKQKDYVQTMISDFGQLVTQWLEQIK